MPDNPALTLGHPGLSGLDAEVLLVAARLFRPGVEDHEVVDDLQETLLRAQLHQCSIEWLLDVRLLAPVEPILLRGVDDAVAQALDVVAGHYQLDGGKERPDEVSPLITDGLADALGDGNPRTLQLDPAQRDAVNVEHKT